MVDELESRYLEGVALWRERNLTAAQEVLGSVVEQGDMTEDSWWHSASRALAQIALESDDPDLAEQHLRKLQGTGVGDAQTSALRAKRWQQVGDEEAAIAEAHIAVTRLAQDHSRDVGSLMNGAIALAWSSEVLVSLGYGGDASDLATRARSRVDEAGVDDRVVETMLRLAEASVTRLVGMFGPALESLDSIDTSLSADFEIQVLRERARIASTLDRTELAAALYERSLVLAQERGYLFFERSITEELTEGPPMLRTDRPPISRWDPRAWEHLEADYQPYALVIRVSDLPDSVTNGLEADIADVLQETGLGVVDGTGRVATEWEILLAGEDPEALLASIKHLLVPTERWPGLQIVMRQGKDTVRVELEE